MRITIGIKIFSQRGRPDGFVLASWPTASMIRRHTPAPSWSCSAKSSSARAAVRLHFSVLTARRGVVKAQAS
jgi:hypothetical protein